MKILDSKKDRLGNGEAPRVLDLFSGCGGLSLGFEKAGFRSLAGVDSDAHAALSYAENFHKTSSNFVALSSPKEIGKYSSEELLRWLGYESPVETVDVLVGGPPCPAFARVGRAKLRAVQGMPLAYKNDLRARLFEPFLDHVEVLQPLAVVMENVPDLLNWGGYNVGEEICQRLSSLGYACAYSLLNSASYGVPQLRERCFLVGLHQSFGVRPTFPTASHFVDFPVGYAGVRDVALRGLRRKLALGGHFVETPLACDSATPAVTAKEAIGDLPVLVEHLQGNDKRGARRFDKPIPYALPKSASSYVRSMREWPGHEGGSILLDHVTRSLSLRDYRLFAAMQPGDDYPAAVKLAERLLEEAQAHAKGSSDTGRIIERRAYVPPYDASKFPNKWRKIEADKPVRTVMAHIGRDTYSHIHYDSAQARVISVREAARLQSFPDGFRFAGTMNPAFRQIGNAVPPLLAFAVAEQVKASLELAIGVNVRVEIDRSPPAPQLLRAVSANT